MPPSESSITASRPTTDTLLSSLGPGTGPGLPWQVVLVAQLVAYMVADVPAYIGCVLGSWVLSLLVPLGPGVLVALGLSVILIPGAAILSGCASAALLQWLGDRLGTLRGRLACVGMTSVTLSFVTYAFVIAPILLGMGFFAVALTTFLSAFLVLPFVQPDASDFAPQWLVRIAPFLAYSLSAAGALGAIVVMALGAVLAPTVGFVVRPILMALVYRLTGRDRQAGEEQWPPSLFGERSDLWWPWRRAPDRPVSPELPSLPAPAPPPSTPSEHMQY